MADTVWVPALHLARISGRPYRTIQRWARLDQIRSRKTRGVLEVAYDDFTREHHRAATRAHKRRNSVAV